MTFKFVCGCVFAINDSGSSLVPPLIPVLLTTAFASGTIISQTTTYFIVIIPKALSGSPIHDPLPAIARRMTHSGKRRVVRAVSAFTSAGGHSPRIITATYPASCRIPATLRHLMIILTFHIVKICCAPFTAWSMLSRQTTPPDKLKFAVELAKESHVNRRRNAIGKLLLADHSLARD